MNLALEHGELHMACWLLGESGRLRAMRVRHDGQENFSPPIFFFEKLEEDLV